MNYLAHALLSHQDPELLLGNFIADHLRGNDFSAFPEGVVKGIRMHREIDRFTDDHPLFKKSKRLFYTNFEKYSGILVDIYFDHLLASDFKSFHTEELKDFNSRIYQVYTDYRNLMPESSSRFLSYLLQNNLYQQYASLEGITRVLGHLSHRIGHQVELQASAGDFTKHQTELSRHFKAFMPELQERFAL